MTNSRLVRRLRALLVTPLLVLAALPACAQEKIVLDGATGVLPLARSLVGAYRQRFPDVQLDVGTGLGTAERLVALSDGRVQIIVASHGLTPENIRAGNLTVIPVAKGAVVFAVNQSVPLENLTEVQVCDIYRGAITGWGSLGGGDSPVAVLTRPASEVDQEVIRARITCFKDLQEVATARVMPRGGDMAKALAETPHALGMTSMTVVAQSGGKVKALSLNGVTPTAENVRSGRYRLTRDFLFVTRGKPARATEKFLDFVRSPEGSRVILDNGAVPVP